MDQQMFTIFQQRFDKLELLLSAHAEKDEKVHQIVDRHETYVRIFTRIVTPAGILAVLGALFAPKVH